MGKSLHFISGAIEAQSRSMANPKSMCCSVPLSTTRMLTAALSWALRSLPCLSHCGTSAQGREAASRGGLRVEGPLRE